MNNLVVDESAVVEASSSFAAATEPDVPRIDPPSSGDLTLMWGVAGEGGERLLNAEVRELNGADEEAMARIGQGHSYFTNLVDTVLRRAVMLVGDKAITPQNGVNVLGDLIVADRDLLFKEIIVATFGTERSYEDIECPSCSGKNDIEVDVEGLLEVIPLKEEPTFEVKLRDGRTVAMHYPLGKDQKAVYAGEADASQAELNTTMIARCIDTVDERPLREQAALKFARDMGMADRRKIVAALAAGPSVSFKEVEVPCTECGEAIPFAFGWADLLWV